MIVIIMGPSDIVASRLCNNKHIIAMQLTSYKEADILCQYCKVLDMPLSATILLAAKSEMAINDEIKN